MHKQVIEFNLAQRTSTHPKIKTGDVVRIHRKIKEGEKERIQIFEGLVIRIQAKQSSSPMVTVRKNSFGVVVEVMIPLHSPIVEKIEIIKKTKTRHSRLYFVREKTDRELRRKLRAVSVNQKVAPVAPKEEVLEKEEVSPEVPSEKTVE